MCRNAHIFHHRKNAISAACLATCALTFTFTSGFTCSFMEVSANKGEVIEVDDPDSGLTVFLDSLSLGVLCEGNYYERDGDDMWELSRIFLIVSLALGGLVTLLGWTLSYWVAPTHGNWKLLSVMAALVAVLQMPVFLIFEAAPCTDFPETQECTLASGSFLLIVSSIFWILITLLTQCVDPPRWHAELNAWKVRQHDKHSLQRAPNSAAPSPRTRVLLSDEDEHGNVDIDNHIQQVEKQAWWKRWGPFSAGGAILGLAATQSNSHDKDEEEDFMLENGSYYANSDNSRLVLKVMPNGKLPGDDARSIQSFGDLDDFSVQQPPLYPHDEEEGSVEVAIVPSSLLGAPEADTETDELHAADLQAAAPGEEAVAPTAFGMMHILGGADQTEENAEGSSIDPRSSAVRSSTGLLDEVKKASPEKGLSTGEEEAAQAPVGMMFLGIRALTNRIKRDTHSSRKVVKGGNAYDMMESEDEESQGYAPPMVMLEVPSLPDQDSEGEWQDLHHAHNASRADDSSDAQSSLPTPEKKARQELQNDWNALHAAAIAGVALHSDDDSGTSGGEEEPEPVYYSSDETRSEISLSSFGNLDFEEEKEHHGSSLSSNSSFSDSSDDEEGNSPARYRSRSEGRGRRRRRSRYRTFSCGGSVSSRTSLLDFTIDEETDGDIQDFESTEDVTPSEGGVDEAYPLQRTKSAPPPEGSRLQGDCSSPYTLARVGSYPTTIIENTNARSTTSTARPPSDESSSSQASSGVMRLAQVVPLGSDHAEEPESTDETEGFSSDNMKLMEGYTPSADEESSFCQPNKNVRRSRSMSLPRWRCNKSHLLSSDDDHSLTSGAPPTPWRDEHFSIGIHSEINIVSDDSSGDDGSMKSSRTSRSNLSRLARESRIRRVQRETEESLKRRRARTLDPPSIRRRGRNPSIRNSVRVLKKDSSATALGSIVVVDRDALGSDEASL